MEGEAFATRHVSMRRTLPRKIGVRTRARDVTGPRVSLYESYNTHASGSGLARVFNCHICHDHFATSYKSPLPFPYPTHFRYVFNAGLPSHGGSLNLVCTNVFCISSPSPCLSKIL